MRSIYDVQTIVPPTLEEAVGQQRNEVPDDNDTLDRLIGYLYRTRPTSREILHEVCEFYKIPPSELVVYRSRGMLEVTFARQVFCYLTHKYTNLTMSQIAKRAGFSDHTTVLHSIRRIERNIVKRPLIEDDIDLLRLKIAERVLRRPHRGAT